MKLWIKSLLWPLQDLSAALPRSGTIIDLGCGDGLVAYYLAQHAPDRHVVGIDLSSTKVSEARSLKPKLPNLQFINQNIIDTNLSGASGCLLSDLLHHLSPSHQLQLLHNLSSQLKPGAVCVIKEANKDNFILTSLTRLWDWILYPDDKINYYSAPKLVKLMIELDFKVSFEPWRHFFPGSVNLFICTKN